MMKQLIWKYKFKEHNIVKPTILQCIENSKKDKRSGLYENITYTDFSEDDDFVNRDYFKLLDPYLKDFFNTLDSKYYCLEHHTSNGWFQQYYTNDEHGWHFHAATNLSCVYYVELSSQKFSTQFWIDDKLYQKNVSEGDIIVFPSFLPHRSPKITKSNTRKTIISFNVNLMHPAFKTLTN